MIVQAHRRIGKGESNGRMCLGTSLSFDRHPGLQKALHGRSTKLKHAGRIVCSTLLLVMLVSTVAFAVDIEIWHSLTPRLGQATLEEVVAEFMETNPDINVEVVYAGGYGDGMEKAMTAYSGGAPPNIMHLEQTRSAAFYYSGALLSIDKYVSGPDGIDLGDFSPTMLGAVTYEGSLYGLPYNISTPLLYYNRNMFLEAGLSGDPPTTSSELLEYSRKIARDRDGDGHTDVFGIDFYSWGWIFESWIGRYGARVHNDDVTAFTFNSPEAIKAMEFVQSLVNEAGVASHKQSYSNFWAGELAMRELSTASLANNINNARENSMDMGVAPLGCEVECYAPIGGGNLFLFDTGTEAQKEASWKLLKFITSSENLARYGADSGYMVARRSSFTSPTLETVFAQQPEFRVTYEQLDIAYPRAKVPFWQSDVAPLLGDFFKAQFDENGNVKTLLDEAVRQANARLSEWRREVGR